jgi:uncharacterized membrane protein YjgN (DUF898 family)
MDIRKYLPNKSAFTALLVGSILAIMIGAVLLVVSYTVINAMVSNTVNTFQTNSYTLGTAGNNSQALNTSFATNINNIVSALNIAGIALIVVGISGIIYMLIGLGGVGAGRQ